MHIDETALLTVAQAARWATAARGVLVTRQAVQNWVTRYRLEPQDVYGCRRASRYLMGDFLRAEMISREADLGIGRGRKAA